MSKKSVTVLVFLFGVCFCLLFIVAAVVAGGYLYQNRSWVKSIIFPAATQILPPGISKNNNAPILQPTVSIVIQPIEAGTSETLNSLKNTSVPENDYRVLSGRLKGIRNIPETVSSSPKNYQLGDTENFWISKDDTHNSFQVKADLRYIGDHVYFWVDEQAKYDQKTLDQLAKTFNDKIYPTDRAFFGSEWTPGIDNDPHLFILYAHGVGNRIAGYFSSRDEYPSQVNPYSNSHEMFVINSDQARLDDTFTYGVLAHEFQHMIHWKRDRNDAAWVNEGFSEVAALLNGYYSGGFDYSFINNPDLQLNDWPNDPQSTTAHYGASFLFLDYFLNRFGEKATQDLVGFKANGLDKVDGVLKDLGIKDNQTGQPIQADDVFSDWVVTNYLLDATVGDGRYQYQNFSAAPKAKATTTIKNCPANISATVHQYGSDYIDITCQGKFILNFQGSTQTNLLPMGAHSGKYAFWSNKGDNSDMTLSHSFDLSDVKGDAYLDYWTWYDLEKDFDYVYLEVSQDGQNWTILKTPSGTDKNPSGESYGWGYNNVSKNWIEERVDLNAFRGEKIQIRFEYVTDDAINGEGFLLDDISLPALSYTANFETDNGGWDAQGFVRIQNILPQTYSLSLIKEGAGKTTVEHISPDSTQAAAIPLDFGGGYQQIILVVSGTTRYTRILAPYKVSISY